uniref:Udp-glucoronosyl and udp-glucosyl transferase n=2 Tax=Lutzomyia longipalpis TaxID=7200 RepID=A0A1B0CGN3_LUTLO
MIVASSLMKGLAARGHSVTVMSGFPQSKPIENYRDIKIHVDDGIKDLISKFSKDGGSQLGFFAHFNEVISVSLRSANNSFNEEAWQKVMREESFDLVVVGMFFNNFVFGLGDHFKCPVIGIFSGGVTDIINEMSGNPMAVDSVPHLFLGKVDEMTFMNRVKTFIFSGLEKLMWTYVNYREKDTTNPLPQKMQEFIDGAEHGVVFFSLGSNVKSSLLALEKLDAILKTFAKLKQRVLFKWEADSLPNQPKNVMTQKWMPQDDILANEKVRVFVSHGGLGGINEAKYHGVPIVGIPFFADQMTNLATAQNEGWAKVVELKDLTEETFTRAILEVVNNQKYRDVVQEISSLFRDRPAAALDTAVYWAEYVIRHKGAPHLQSHAVKLNFLQRTSIDVIAFIAIVLLVVFKVIALSLCFCWRKVTKSGGPPPKRSRKNPKSKGD